MISKRLSLGWILAYLYRHFCVVGTRLMIEFDIMLAPITTDYQGGMNE
jgi:hypothetical protein